MADWVLSVLVVTGALVYLRAATNLERLQVGDMLGPQVFETIVAVLMLCRTPPRCAPRKALRNLHCSVSKGERRWHPASSTSP